MIGEKVFCDGFQKSPHRQAVKSYRSLVNASESSPKKGAKKV